MAASSRARRRRRRDQARTAFQPDRVALAGQDWRRPTAGRAAKRGERGGSAEARVVGAQLAVAAVSVAVAAHVAVLLGVGGIGHPRQRSCW